MTLRVMFALLCALFWTAAANAQGLQRVPNCGTGQPAPGMSPGTQDTTGAACVSTAIAYRVATVPVVQAAQYVSGNCVGSFNAVTVAVVNGQSGLLNAVSVKLVGGGTPTLTVYTFDASPAASTCTDKSTFSIAAADEAKLIAAPFALTLAAPTGTTTTYAENTSMGRFFWAGGSSTSGVKTIYFAVVSGSTFTPSAVTSLQVDLQGEMN